MDFLRHLSFVIPIALGIFGGTFDPVHFGHLLLAECCREQCRLDAVWFLPAAVPPHKQQREPTPAPHRIEMLELAIAGNSAFSVCRYEADRGGVNYTVDTLGTSMRKTQAASCSCCSGPTCWPICPIGAAPRGFASWPYRLPYAGPAVGRLISTAYVELPIRSGSNYRRHQVEMPEIGISSTELRCRVELGQSIRYRTPRAVEMYIETHDSTVAHKWHNQVDGFASTHTDWHGAGCSTQRRRLWGLGHRDCFVQLPLYLPLWPKLGDWLYPGFFLALGLMVTVPFLLARMAPGPQASINSGFPCVVPMVVVCRHGCPTVRLRGDFQTAGKHGTAEVQPPFVEAELHTKFHYWRRFSLWKPDRSAVPHRGRDFLARLPA